MNPDPVVRDLRGLLQQQLARCQCGICLDTVQNPVIACPSLHLFCKSCIKTWHKRSKQCPTCRQRCSVLHLPANRLPDTGAHPVVTNTLFRRDLAMMLCGSAVTVVVLALQSYFNSNN